MAAPTITSITNLPTRSDPANFNAYAEDVWNQLNVSVGDINSFGTWLNENSTIVGAALNGTTIGLTTPAAADFTAITGSGDLNIDGGTLFVDASTNRLGVGILAPEVSLDIAASGAGIIDAVRLGNFSGDGNRIGSKRSLVLGADIDANSNASQSYMAFETDAVERVRISSAGNVGMGISAPTAKLDVYNSADTHAVRADSINATLTADVARLKATRAASAAYNFLTAYSGGLADLKAKLDGTGTLTVDGTVTGGGADVAEFYLYDDGNPMAEDRRGISVVLVGDKIREAVAGEEPFGVISSRPTLTMNAESLKWAGKYLRDDFDCDILEDYEVVSWTAQETTTETVTEQATETQQYDETVVEIINYAAVQTTVTRTREVPLFDEYPLSDEAGNDLGIHREPRMIEVTRETTKEVEHSYAADEVPDGITVPAGAARVTQQRQKLNPDYVSGTDYVPRQDRPEWASVGVLGRIRVRTGQITGAGWTKLRDVSAQVEEWLVR